MMFSLIGKGYPNKHVNFILKYIFFLLRMDTASMFWGNLDEPKLRIIKAFIMSMR